MPELSLQNIDQISRDVTRQEISFSHLADELIDHLCCDVEHEMMKGLSFQEAYRVVREKLGSRRLREIQEETLFAVDTKYRKMKTTMKISAIAGTILLGFASLFKIMHWAGAGIMLTIGALLLAFLFMPSALGVLWKETHSPKKLFLYISAFLTATFFIAGVVFKIQHWPGSSVGMLIAAACGIIFFIPAFLAFKLKDQENSTKKAIYIIGTAGLIMYVLGFFFKLQHWPLASMLLMTGLAVIFFVAIPWYVSATWKEANNVSPKFFFMVVGSLAIVIPSLLINLNLSRNYDGGYYMHQWEQQALFKYRQAENRKLMLGCHDSITAPLLAEIDTKTGELLRIINDIETGMVAESEGEPGNPAIITHQVKETEAGPEIQFSKLQNPFHTVPYLNFLIEGTSSRNDLDRALNDYSDYLTQLIPGIETEKYQKLLDPSVYLPAADPETERISLMVALHRLELLKNSILAVESYAFAAVANR